MLMLFIFKVHPELCNVGKWAYQRIKTVQLSLCVGLAFHQRVYMQDGNACGHVLHCLTGLSIGWCGQRD